MVSLTTVFFVAVSVVNDLVTASLLPPHSWDSHIHVIDPERFPLSPDREYTPKPAPNANATAFQKRMDISHFTIVLPSVYGTDNRVLLDSLKYFSGSARGVCVINPETVSETELQELHDAGVRGVRVNFGSDGTNEEIVDAVKANAAVAKIHNWVLQVWIPIRAFKALYTVIPELGIRVVTDHYGHAEVGSRTNYTLDTIDPYQKTGFSEMTDLVRRRLLFVKISAPYLNSKKSPLYEDMRVVAETLMLNGPEMCVWASDWPHTSNKEGNDAVGGRLNPQDYRNVSDESIVKVIKEWAGSEAQIQRLFVDNPRRLWSWSDTSS